MVRYGRISGGGPGAAAPARQAGQAIAGAAGVTLTGSLAGTNAGQPVRLTVIPAGTVTGTYTQDNGKVSLITIAGITFLNAPQAFWENQGAPFDTGPPAGGRWALASPADTVSMSPFIPSDGRTPTPAR
jgi:hypothetical protein